MAQPGARPGAETLDSLTGLPNRRRFIEKVEALIDQRRSDPAPFAVAIIDFMDFRPINDVFGSEAGDDILAQAGMRLMNATNGETLVARVGGDVFGVLMPMAFNESAARGTTELFCDLLSAPFDIGERTVRVACTAGIALWTTPFQQAAALVRNAETALYTTKKSKSGAIIVHDRAMEEEARRLIRMEQALRNAISAGMVDVHFQPIICFRRNRIAGFEALARWTDPDFGPVRPDIFIDIAERRGLIGPLSRVLFEKALIAMRGWPEDVFLSFNLSPSQLSDASTAANVMAALHRHGIQPNRLELEITETAVMANPGAAARVIADLKTHKIRISLDDFGTGQSSLGRLRELPFDKLKIDRAFVSSLLSDHASETIIRAILAMCHGLGIKVIAEGIETREQAARLVQLGCHGGQGWLFGKPKDTAATAALLNANGLAKA
ncbi:MAG: EAL domain-containing protein [Rhizobiaceae bacterium]|nr:EAL domain-containing protein [Rhizobiaceae bacterium]